MAVYDRWHRDPQDGGQPCEHSRGRRKLYAAAGHGKGRRWQVQWEDPHSATRKRLKRSFDLKDGDDPNVHADAFDKLMQGKIVTKNYADPRAGEVTLRDYAEKWRPTRTHGESARDNLEARLRLHVYEDPGKAGSGRTPRGGVSLGQHAMGLLERRPSLTAAWVASIPLAEGSARLVVGDVSSVFRAAIEDGIVGRDPTRSSSVDRPGKGGTEAQPYSAAEVAGIAAKLPERFRIIPEIGVTCGARRMEMAAMGADDIVRGKAPKVRVLRQLKIIDGELRFGPMKNETPHDVPVPQDFIDHLDAHMKRWPPAAVTLPWHEPGSKMHGQPLTVRLLLPQESGRPLTRNLIEGMWVTAVTAWRRSQARRRLEAAAAGAPAARTARSARGYGMHRMRHTAASNWLRSGIDVARVAAWLGDTIEVVTKTYLHLVPDDHSGEEAGRTATSAFLSACALAVPPPEAKPETGLMRAV